MPARTKALRYHAFGKPDEILHIDSADLRPCQPGEVLIRMEASPINPADLNVLEGTYPHRDDPPAIAGIEGCGTVVEGGLGARRIRMGERVIAPRLKGHWCTYRIAKEEDLVIVPPAIPPAQAAMLAVNPATAWRMLADFRSLKAGDWIIQNAANSGVGRAVIQLAKARQLRTINLVRREESIRELTDIGATVTIVANDDAPAKIREAIGESPITLGLNATGGPILRLLTKCLSDGACLVTYGAMSRETFSLGNGQLIFNDLTARGFWITRWYQKASAQEIRDMMAKLLPLAAEGRLFAPVEQAYSMDQYPQALAHAAQEGRFGKIIFSMDG